MEPAKIRRVTCWGATVIGVVALLALSGVMLNQHIESELDRARNEAAIDYVKAGKFPLRHKEGRPEAVEQPSASHHQSFQEILEEAIEGEAMHHKIRALMATAERAGVSLPPDIDQDAAADECAARADAAPAAWQRDHQTQILLRDLLARSAANLAGTPKEITGLFRGVALYLSLPFRIALGVGFGVLLGAWLMKKAGLGRI